MVLVAATIDSEPGDIGFIEPGGLATSGLTAVIDGWVSVGREAGVANGADDDVN